MKYRVLLSEDPDRNGEMWWCAQCLEAPIATQAKSQNEALNDITDMLANFIFRQSKNEGWGDLDFLEWMENEFARGTDIIDEVFSKTVSITSENEDFNTPPPTLVTFHIHIREELK